jgi:CPA2 family monovalent cation:H+ antiporter-2
MGLMDTPEMTKFWSSLQDVAVLFAAALLFGSVFERLRQSAIAGFLIAGALIGPGGLGLVSQPKLVESLSELGIALLLFTIGLEFSARRLVALGRIAIAGGAMQILLTALVFGALARATGLPWHTALTLGLLAAPSSTATVLRLLADRTDLDTPRGRGAMGILLLQDLALVPMVLAVTALGRGATWQGLMTEIGVAAAFFLLLAMLFYATSRFVLPRALLAVGRIQSREILILFAIVLALGAMWSAHALEVSPALGAFIAGMLLAESPFATQLRSNIGTLRVVFVTLFFVSVGMLADFAWMLDHWLLVTAALVLIVLIKSALVWGIARMLGQTHRHAVAMGFYLAQIGEFSLMLAAVALNAGSLDATAYQLVISACLLSLMLTPMLVALGPRAGAGVEALFRQAGLAGPPDPAATPSHVALSGHVIVAGYGPAGRSVVEAVQAIGVPVVILELNPHTVREAQAAGLTAHLGDACRDEVLEHAGLASASALVITVPDYDATLGAIRHAVALAPHVPVIVRARYHRFARDFSEAGASFVIDEETQIGQFLGARLAKGLARTAGLATTPPAPTP